jgi:hypothetical protein
MKNLDDIFDKLNKSLIPSMEQLRELQEQLGHNIQLGIIEELMAAQTLSDVDNIISDNEWYFERWPQLIRQAALARCRIENLTLTKFKSWNITDLN